MRYSHLEDIGNKLVINKEDLTSKRHPQSQRSLQK